MDTAQYQHYEILRMGDETVVRDRVDAAYGMENFVFPDQSVDVHAITQFNALGHIASHGDLMIILGADIAAGLSHYLISGAAEGRTFIFAASTYLASPPICGKAMRQSPQPKSAVRQKICKQAAQRRNFWRVWMVPIRWRAGRVRICSFSRTGSAMT
ncbi:hypothetical protein FEE96_15635 [Parasedimentitalea maritima]|uniref:Uncharacterized protein n=1 Tax=Parasedimentitalea maritima TaxID=2578117 RepID=A0ABY2UTQ2_9RHOB|nr:hypothetical protein [Zongyanglinia marina]TLP60292.1 hypothetical protein FEE96_15635 [Zongyanglinia marina]